MLHRAALAVLAVGIVGCAPTYPKCEKDEHCKADGHDEVCVNGLCQECGKDADCKKDFVCQANKCVPKPECTADGECQPGFKCRGQKCVPECAIDADCANGMTCVGGHCTPSGECSTDADCRSGKRCNASHRCAEAEDSGGPCQLETVHFDFNDSSLTADARRVLETDVRCLKTGKSRVVLAGYCDERGTEDYNLHLGERRAASVKKYLSAMGIDPKHLKTISYGKERPVNPGHDEAAWAENRRVELSRQ